MDDECGSINLSASFVNFVFPFLFEGDTFAKRVAAIKLAQWQGRERSLPVWQPDQFPEDELLPHVAGYLNPSDDTRATAQMWALEPGTLQSAAGMGGQATWWLTFPHAEVPFTLEAVRLALFRVGVGFLTVRTQPATAEPTAWYDFLHYFRFVQGQRSVAVRAERSIGVNPQTRHPTIGPFFPEPAGGLVQHPDGKGVFGTVLAAILRTGALSSEAEPWWGEVFVPGQLLPFAVVYGDGFPKAKAPHLLYRMRHFFHGRQEIHPAPPDLRLEHPSLLPYAAGLWFIFSLDGGAFVACDAPTTDFFRVQLPDHLGRQYFLLFLLALHQRFALMELSENVAAYWPLDGSVGDEVARERAFGEIRDRFLAFTARGNFTQVMQQEHHHRCYRR